jgi:hypothetical protein
MKYITREHTEMYKKTISLVCIVLVLLLYYIYSIHAWLMDHADSKNISVFQMEKANTVSSTTLISLEEEFPNVQLSSIQYHVQH